MPITHLIDGDLLVVRPENPTSVTLEPDFDGAILALLADSGARWLIVDFGDVRMFQSLGISALIHVQRHCRQAGVAMAVCGLSSDVSNVFKITGLNRLVRVYATEAEARSGLRPPEMAP